jgi:hypothetical protein
MIREVRHCIDVQIAGRAASDDMAQDSSPRVLKRLARLSMRPETKCATREGRAQITVTMASLIMSW